jgi:hypothetical protein
MTPPYRRTIRVCPPTAVALTLSASLAILSSSVAPRAAHAQAGTDPNMARALRVLRSAPVMDGHNDLPWRIREDTVHPMDVEAYDLHKKTPGMTDLARLKQGHVGAQFWSIYIPGEPTDPAYKSKGACGQHAGIRSRSARADRHRAPCNREVLLSSSGRRRQPMSAPRCKPARSRRSWDSRAVMRSRTRSRCSGQYYDMGARYMTLDAST